MDYEGQICRPPMERASFMLPVMVGCSYNACKFCNLFRSVKSRRLPLEQIQNELLRVKNLGGDLKTVFLGDGTAFGLPTAELLSILKLIRKIFPNCTSVNMDARVKNILDKSDSELKLLQENGVDYLYIGVETGLDDVLAFMQKGHTICDAKLAIARLKKAGLNFGAHIMTGIAGKGRGQENAKSLAEFFYKTKPSRIINFSLFLHEETLLGREIKNGNFLPATELENLQEEKTLIELLSKNGFTTNYDGLHDFIGFRVRGLLPQNKTQMLAKLETKITELKKTPAIYSFVRGECTIGVLEKTFNQEKVWG